MLGGFGKFMGKVFDSGAMGVLAVGAALPAVAGYALGKIEGLNMLPMGIRNVLGNSYVRAGSLIGLSGLTAYALNRYGMLSMNAAVGATTLATFLYVVGAVKSSGLLSSIPVVGPVVEQFPSMNGYHPMAGYRGGYLGYLGNVHSDMGATEMLDAPVETQLFGVGSSPQYNVF